MVSHSELLSHADGVGVANLQLSSYYVLMYAREAECLRGEVSVRSSYVIYGYVGRAI